MEPIYSSELAEHVGERVLLAGWVHARRDLGSVSFLVLRDRAGLAQVVLDDGPLEFLAESVVEVEGLVVAAEQALAQGERRSLDRGFDLERTHQRPCESACGLATKNLPTTCLIFCADENALQEKQAEMELDLLLRVWQVMHPGIRIEVIR